MTDQPKPVRSAAALRPNQVAEYTLSIQIVATAPPFDEKRTRKLIDDEFARLATTLKNCK
jgi:hypothetical protein